MSSEMFSRFSRNYNKTRLQEMHRYIDSLMQADMFHTEGGGESFEEWIRGPFYHFLWPKDDMEQSTRVSVNFKFARPFGDNEEHQVMLFSQWRSAFKIVHKDGRIQATTMQDL